MNTKPDKRLVSALLSYDSLAALYEAMGATDDRKRRYVDEHAMPRETLKTLIAAGMAFEFGRLTHDDAVDRSFSTFKLLQKSQVVHHFVSSLSAARADWRAGLSAYAMMQTMPAHTFQPTEAGFCSICSGMPESQFFDRTALNRLRFSSGSLAVFKTPFEIQFFLEQEAQLEAVEPTKTDLLLLDRLWDCIASSAAQGPTDLAKEVRAIPGLKVSPEQARGLVETLGLCGVLRTAEHPGYDGRFTNPGLAPSKTSSSNWAYPVDFWTAKDGLCEKAVRFWFG